MSGSRDNVRGVRRRRILLVLAGLVLVAGIAVASLTFPTRSGCDDGTGAPSPDIPLSLCATPRSLLPKRTETPVVPRVAVIGLSGIVASILLWAAFDDEAKALSKAHERQ
jgi:hypothetical protein